MPVIVKFATRLILVAFVVTAIAHLGAPRAHGVGSTTGWDVTSGADMVVDDARNRVYVTAGSQVLTFDYVQRTALAPRELGGQLIGIDLSADGRFLAVADRTNLHVHVVDLEADQESTIPIEPVQGEVGTFDVAYCDDGSLLVTTEYASAGWTPLRRYSPEEGWSTLASLSSGWHSGPVLSPNRDHSFVGVIEPNNSSGKLLRYRSSDRTLQVWGYGGVYFFDVAASRTGEMAVFSRHQMHVVGGANLTARWTINYSDLRAHPVTGFFSDAQSVLYTGWAGSSIGILAHNPATGAIVDRPWGTALSYPDKPGQAEKLAESEDGRYLFILHPYVFAMSDQYRTALVTASLSSELLWPGELFAIDGKLVRSARVPTPIAGEELVIQKLSKGSSAWQDVVSVTTREDGSFSWIGTAESSGSYRVRWPGKGAYFAPTISTSMPLAVWSQTELVLRTDDHNPDYGADARVDVHPGPNTTPLSFGSRVWLERRSATGWERIREAQVNSRGVGTFWVDDLTTAETYRAQVEQKAPHNAAVSAALKITPEAQLTRSTSWSRLRPGKTYTAKGGAKPTAVASGKKVVIRAYRRRANGMYPRASSPTRVFKAGSVYRPTQRGLSYRVPVKFTKKDRGVWRLVAYRPGDSMNAATYGKPDHVVVR